MRFTFALGFIILFASSCAKKKDCLSHESDEVFLSIVDSNGVNKLETEYLAKPMISFVQDQATSGSVHNFQRIELEDGVYWIVDINRINNERSYQVLTESAAFSLEIDWDLQDPECNKYKKYKGRKLNWIKFNDTIFYGPGEHVFLE